MHQALYIDTIDYRIAKAYEVYQEAKDMATLSHWSLVVDRLYHSVLHMANALLLQNGISGKIHKGVMRQLMKAFVRPGILSKDEGQLFATLFDMQNKGTYEDLFDWTEDKVTPLFAPTHALLTKLHSLITTPQETEYSESNGMLQAVDCQE